jgi:hypothetical protein
MKICYLLSVLTFMLAAQAPPPPITPETVVVKIDGKDITVAELTKMLAGPGTNPVVAQTLRSDPARAVEGVYLTVVEAADAQRLKLQDMSPWKEQIEAKTDEILLNARLSYEADHYEVSAERISDYYDKHKNDYQQAKIKAIKINFKPEVKASPNDLKGAARRAVEAAHAPTDRTEAEAKKLAEEVVKQARAGVDFAKLIEKYAEGESKDFAGDYPAVKQTSNYTADIKKTVFAMKPGEVSDPVHQSNAFYVIRVTELTAQPLNDVRADILQTLRQQHVTEYFAALQKRFTPVIVRPDYFFQMNALPGK